ncbi:APSES transcription factor Xbp1 [Aspergillus luchuensis]|uniref:APSES transcription factor Xbp1 n=1 Tax=Aspergillus kawachii TaxID=1069201 RepID=A0A146FTG6_ASPKA|nr:APSES transcription factor Xbp1 [Aspergillus luchuensis]
MTSINSLLNPDTSCPSLNRGSIQRGVSLQTPRSERTKVPKDQPSFRRGKIQGEVRYRVHDERDEELKKIHLKHKLYPMGNIADFPDRIPYTSTKRSFKERTGRERFEDRSREGVENEPGPQRDHLQHHGWRTRRTRAAKALAATFCWNIRFLLTPMFGLDFPAQCIPPNDARFNNMIIDPEIVRQATEDVAYYRSLEPLVPRRGGHQNAQELDRDQQCKTRDASPCQQTCPNVPLHDTYCVSPTSSSQNTYMLANTPYITDESISPHAVFERGMREDFRSETSSQLTFYGSSLSSNHLSDDDHKRDSQVDPQESYYSSDLSSADVILAAEMVDACFWQPTDTCEPEAPLEGSRTAIAAHALMDLRNSGFRYKML